MEDKYSDAGVTDRLLVEQVLQDTTEDLEFQCSSVDRAFSRRVQELIEAKTQMETKLAQVEKQTNTQTDSVTHCLKVPYYAKCTF